MRKKTIAATLCFVLTAGSLVGCGETSGTTHDIFYSTHKNDFVTDTEKFYANSPEGSVYVYKKPGGTTSGDIENGDTITAQYLYTDSDGTEWIFIGSGQYVKVEDLLSVYDFEFLEDNSSALSESIPENAKSLEENMQAQIDNTESGHLVYLAWNYPHGLASAVGTIDDVADVVENCTYYYTDDGDLVWGYYEYYYTQKNIWLCLSDICNTELAEDEIYTGDIFFEPAGTIEAEIDSDKFDGCLPGSGNANQYPQH